MCLGVPGRLIERHDDRGLPMGTVDFGGVRREVCLAYVADEVAPGDYVVVHVGFAIARLDEVEAQRTLALLRQYGALDDPDPVANRTDSAGPAAASDRPLA